MLISLLRFATPDMYQAALHFTYRATIIYGMIGIDREHLYLYRKIHKGAFLMYFTIPRERTE